MALEFALGDKIKTPFGHAIVRQILSKTIKIELLSGVMKGQFIFLDPLRYEDEIVFIEREPPPVPKSPTVKPPPTTKLGQYNLERRRCIDSLRFGLVPIDYISELTLGFDSIKNGQTLPSPTRTLAIPRFIKLLDHLGREKAIFYR